MPLECKMKIFASLSILFIIDAQTDRGESKLHNEIKHWMWKRLQKVWHQCSLFFANNYLDTSNNRSYYTCVRVYFRYFMNDIFYWNLLKVNALFLLQKYKHQLLSVSFQPTHPKNNFAYVACQCFTKGWPNLVKFHIIWQVKTDPLIGYVKFLTTQGFIAASMNSYRH